MEEIQDISSFSVDTTGYILFYSKPIGSSLTDEGIRFFDNTVQTTAIPPVGTIINWIDQNDQIPTGWKLCNGDPLLISGYGELYAVIGTNFGSVGTDYFRLPNLGNRFPLGYSNDISTTNDISYDSSNREGGNAQIQPSQFIHKHNVNTSNYITKGIFRQNADPGSNSWRSYGYNVNSGNVQTDTMSGSQQDYYPPYIGVMYIIKYTSN
jgi:microcystin-dependent protein